MSQDLKIYKICDHRIIKEQVYIDSDYKTIHIPRNLATKNVDLWVNGYLTPSKNNFHGWILQEDPTIIYAKRYKIIFNKKNKSLDDFYFISYSVPTAYCPKCLGLGVLNDESYDRLGKAYMVQNEDKLMQEVKKGVSTNLGSNPFHVWIGTLIYQLIGSKVYNVDSIKSKIVYEINNYLEQYLDVQIQQYNYQTVTDREAFLKILSIDVAPQIQTDVSYWIVTIIFRNRAGQDYIYEKQLAQPGTSINQSP